MMKEKTSGNSAQLKTGQQHDCNWGVWQVGPFMVHKNHTYDYCECDY